MEVLNMIDRGGFGRVERVRLSGGDIVARKVFDPSPALALDPADMKKFRRRFEREVKVQSALDESYFLPILDNDLGADEPWFTMPLAEKSYRDQIADDHKAGSVGPEPLGDILNSLEELHRLGYVHRDLKPENVLFHDGVWKLSDFGLVTSKPGSTTKLTSLDSAWGSEQYCAPEQATGFGSVKATADIYAFGCILHDIVVGQTRIPYARHSSSGPLAPVIEKCTEVDPRKRFQETAVLQGVLMRILAKPHDTPALKEDLEWAKLLEDLESLERTVFQDLARYVARVDTPHEARSIFRSLDVGTLRQLKKLDDDSWGVIARRYCEWAHRSGFDFNYCDVVVKSLECIFDLGDIECKAEAAVSAAELGKGHNRFFVMERLIYMCNEDLDDDVADRVAIEILVRGEGPNFKTCAETIGRSLDSYHPAIRKALEGDH